MMTFVRFGRCRMAQALLPGFDGSVLALVCNQIRLRITDPSSEQQPGHAAKVKWT
jgi:hypothetical protein